MHAPGPLYSEADERDHGPLHHPPAAVGRRAALRGQLRHLRDLLRAADRRPGAAARRPPAEPAAGRADPAQPRARQAVVPAVLRLHEAARPALRLRLQLPEQRRRQGADLRPPAATISLAVGAAVVWLVVGIAVGIISAVRRRSLLDRVAMGAALVAISAPVYWLGLVVALPVLGRHRQVPDLPGRRQLRAAQRGPGASGSRR